VLSYLYPFRQKELPFSARIIRKLKSQHPLSPKLHKLVSTPTFWPIAKVVKILWRKLYLPTTVGNNKRLRN
jgi:hypothetical protein